MAQGPATMRQSKAIWALITQGALLGGCTPAYDERHAFDQGWRSGEVRRIGAAAELGGASIDCRPGPAPALGQDDMGGRYALVLMDGQQTARRYPRTGLARRYAIVPIPVERSLALGDEVFVHTRDCDIPLEHRTPAYR